MALPNTTSKNDWYRIHELAEHVAAGRIRVPEFQRSFRWRPKDVLSLFDSILRGYPFGSVLLWRRPAPAASVTIGALEVEAPEQTDALWVVDGQQRITSLVNAVSVVASVDERFALSFLLEDRQFVLTKDVRGRLAAPVADLFDFGRALAWIQDNPDSLPYAQDIQDVTARLRDVVVPASIIAENDESVLREVFNRINTAGRKLNAYEIFDAINSATVDPEGRRISTTVIADRLASATSFGRLADDAVYQAILVIRHTDLTRNVHTEFSTDRDIELDFSGDDETDAYKRGEHALTLAIRFLQETAGVPHSSFVPFRFHLLVLARFFAHHPNAETRNLHLLSRWLWRSTSLAGPLGFTGSTATVRRLAGMIQQDDESGSVQRLLAATEHASGLVVPSVAAFRTNSATGKMILSALWALGPIDPTTGDRLSAADLAEALGAETQPRHVALPLSNNGTGTNAANRVISTVDRQSFFENLRPEHLASHLLDEAMLSSIEAHGTEFLVDREQRVADQVRCFLAERTGDGFSTTPPLSQFDLDDLYDEDGTSL
ncbi:DUF262 domain-containing protein [Brachybacterium kimchii]|uniref:DUF262 domain-containing protein n=1 Tax=Brachybacterium kimchii TaxID=2942909 RepID=A0ABY4ND29_9MICO|nr:DUF262 domain-containing protein [Brachybacterium kimchii]UQN31460.1 DUF262 domain-containing protein [Brachybacterium kimchii]